MPGILTALGGLVTAVGTIIALYLNGQSGGDEEARPSPPAAPPSIVVLQQPAAPAPDAASVVSSSGSSRTSDAFAGDATGSDSDAIIAEWVGTLDPDMEAIVEGCADGYAGDCGSMLEILTGECEYGYALSCDVLFLSSPSGSALEQYGNTCGGRLSTSNNAWCRDLVS